MWMTFLLVVHALIALALVAVILMQRSEGGGIAGGGTAGGLVSPRGAADLLTRTTAVLATLFILSSLGLAVLAGATRQPRPIDTTLARPAAAPPVDSTPAPAPPPQDSSDDLPPIQR
ncbi:MAG: preprotein translocase subunit SecG [Sphingomonadaceae bacterium]|uniref:preprotein translocase subunit SecG n=1 Tax=Thermaurantiacus sp. TaxID=2820283 RepID=UPI00298F33D5|nr:preprotein translocase subunit SecG [Thermaurantiacus sp.]MCS6986530.1 preprotein translocase subunit SecG [Sphingomonadaceae bacterium]MDW8414209.1 preprotein translocase subunit SecG [Thermaurantiacus sp.]